MIRRDDRERRYVLRLEGAAPGHWIGEIWFGRALHQRRRVAGVHDANQLRQAFLRELHDLVTDGWVET